MDITVHDALATPKTHTIPGFTAHAITAAGDLLAGISDDSGCHLQTRKLDATMVLSVGVSLEALRACRAPLEGEPLPRPMGTRAQADNLSLHLAPEGLAMSPDGRRIGFVSGRHVFLFHGESGWAVRRLITLTQRDITAIDLSDDRIYRHHVLGPHHHHPGLPSFRTGLRPWTLSGHDGWRWLVARAVLAGGRYAGVARPLRGHAHSGRAELDWALRVPRLLPPEALAGCLGRGGGAESVWLSGAGPSGRWQDAWDGGGGAGAPELRDDGQLSRFSLLRGGGDGLPPGQARRAPAMADACIRIRSAHLVQRSAHPAAHRKDSPGRRTAPSAGREPRFSESLRVRAMPEPPRAPSPCLQEAPCKPRCCCARVRKK